MTRTKYILALVGFSVLAGIVPNFFPDNRNEEILHKAAFVLIVFIIPTLATIRMKYIGQSWKDYLKGLIPFYGIKYRFKRFTQE